MIELWQQQIKADTTKGQRIRLRGGGSKDFYGEKACGDILDTRAYCGIIDYEPTELVITARCGTPLAELENTLAEQQQMLAFEPPHLGPATVGGCVASGLSGPRRIRAGAARDYVLGASLLDGHGRHLKFGGQVMKNVAGYDVSRLLVGSLGTLGLITEVSLKVLPKPECELTLHREADQPTALKTLRQWAAKPLPISASSWHNGELRIRLSGAASAVKGCALQLGGETVEQAAAQRYWQELKEQQLDFFDDSDRPLWRLSLPASAPPLAWGEVLLEWNGTQRWLYSDLPASAIRQQVSELGGHATMFRSADKSAGVFSPLPAAAQRLHQNLKQQFDPRGLFNPGRLYPDL